MPRTAKTVEWTQSSTPPNMLEKLPDRKIRLAEQIN